MKPILPLALFALLGSTSTLARDTCGDPDADARHFGDRDDILRWTPVQQVAGYRNIERLAPARRIAASTDPLVLPRAERDLGGVRLEGEYEDRGFSLTVDEFFAEERVAGLLVIDDGTIVYERYGLGNSESCRWVSFSVTKSVVSLLFGAAIREGYVAGVDEQVTDYLPRLKGSAYAGTSLRHLLHMASGVAWNEDYTDPESDVSRADWETLELYRFLSGQPRVAPPGEVFNYNTAETNLAGNLLRAALGNNLSVYLEHTIWQPFGMEFDAWWPLTEPGGGEFGGCCLAASLRDYGRLGLFALAGGRLPDGTPVLADGWMEESTTPSPAAEFYGYFWWLREGGAFQASGIFGQSIFIDPGEQIVIALHSARPQASDRLAWRKQMALMHGLVRELSASD